MNYKEKFMDWWGTVSTSTHPIITDMRKTVENSPYHREPNVLEHTKMVVDFYIKFTDDNTVEWSYRDLQGAVACVFHDFGKPDTEEEFFSETLERVIRQYKGHEIVSAGHFMDIWVTNILDIKDIIPDVDAFYNVWVMIAYHLPYSLTGNKLSTLRTHLEKYEIYNVFTRVLLSDTHGRIQDEREKEIDGCINWIHDFNDVPLIESKNDPKNGTIEVLIGISGSGKSTYASSKDAKVFSFDAIRYALCPNASTYNDVFYSFNAYFDDDERDPSLVHERLGIGKQDRLYGQNEVLIMAMQDAVKTCGSDELMIIDNTSLSRKSRRVIASSNSKTKRHLVGKMFIRSKEQLFSNDNSREENERRGKRVIESMYYRYFPVLFGEVDEIKLIEE